MTEAWLFKKSLVLIAYLSATPYLSWPIFIISGLFFLFNRFYPIPAWQAPLLKVWIGFVIIGIAIATSLVFAFFTRPANNQVAGTMMYISLIASLPIIIPLLIISLCKPSV
jgi:hypothetical protein